MSALEVPAMVVVTGLDDCENPALGALEGVCVRDGTLSDRPRYRFTGEAEVAGGELVFLFNLDAAWRVASASMVQRRTSWLTSENYEFPSPASPGLR
mmetsp:Transcript_32246/g.113520  ORF Transcript_32246/g.113520 Transcript_32246/m.113520 type:complete len:97 (+) Transcript_32246:118-408(+)